MPSIEQCDAAAINVAALPSTLEIFDKFKPISDNDKDSDSEESFHLPLDDYEVENQSIETEDEILNKFDTAPSDTPDNLDSIIEDSILNNIDDEIAEDKPEINPLQEESSIDNTETHSNFNIKITYTSSGFADYENNENGEFKSIYETDPELNNIDSKENEVVEEPMEVTEGQILTIDEERKLDNTACMEVEEQETKDEVQIEYENDKEEIDANILENNLIEDDDVVMLEDLQEGNVSEEHEEIKVNGENNTTSSIDVTKAETITMDAGNELTENENQGPKEDNKESEIRENPADTEKGQLTDSKTDDLANSEVLADSEIVEINKDSTAEIVEINKDSTTEIVEINNDSTTEIVEINKDSPTEIVEPELAKSTDNENISADEVNEESPILIEQEDSNDKSEVLNEATTDSKISNLTPEVEEEKIAATEADIFKIPEVVPVISKEPFTTTQEENLDLCNEKSNDKSEEDESELLDISMVRETEEDDACAIADAIEENMEQAEEKSDEEQSEKPEIDQEDESNDDNDNTMGFEDMDEDSRIDADDSSNMTNENKTDQQSESSKDSFEELNLPPPRKRFKKAEENGVDEPSIASEDNVIDDVSEEIASDEGQLVLDEVENGADQDDVVTSDVDKTDENETKDEDGEVSSEVAEMPIEESEESSEAHKSLNNKRSLSFSEPDDLQISTKKAKVANELDDTTVQPISNEIITTNTSELPPSTEKVKTLTSFTKFMQCRKLTAKLSRSDLEQFCIQKICESLMLKSSEGELHQTIKKHEKTIEALRKDFQNLNKQCKDLEIVNRKLMSELRNQNGLKKPLVPLKITRSVGLQVRLNPGNEVVTNQTRRSRPLNTTPQKTVMSSPNNVLNRTKVTPGNLQQSTAVRQVMASPQKSPLTAGQTTTSPMLTQALQKRAQPVIAKRTNAPVQRKSLDGSSKPATPGVIDLTDEDDKLAQSATSQKIRIINKGAQPATPGKAKAGPNAKPLGKQVPVTKQVSAGNKGNLSQGIRLTPAITSTANGTPQMVYVVPTISNAGGQQKVAFVNFQPTNGVLSGTLNGSTMSVLPGKQGQTLTLKTVPSPIRNKHPAPLPAPPRVNLDPKLKALLPKPILTIKKIDTGIILQWKMPYNLDQYESIASYQLYAYQETNAIPSTDMWRKVGDVKALALPMACTLTQFADKNKYYFAVRSVDVYKRIGAFSDPEEISL